MPPRLRVVVDRLEDEIEAIGRELSGAVGLGGRDRRVAQLIERQAIEVGNTGKMDS
jgi:hypothetical protein